MFSFPWRRGFCSTKDDIIVISRNEYKQPLKESQRWMLDFQKYKRPTGPRFPDGSVNWQCPCMAGGSMVSHRCGFYFRRLYMCMAENDNENVTEKCPHQFVDWSACMQGLSDERREQMRRSLVDPSIKVSVSR